MELVLTTFLSLDGVMQGPGGPDEDRSGGFDRGGWLVPFADADMGAIVSAWFADADEILLGRITYDMMYSYWSQVTEPGDVVSDRLNHRPKHVVSTTLRDPAWEHTSVISSDPVAAVAALMERPGGELQVHGSCALARTLHEAALIDEYRFLVFPVVVGDGKRLFPAGSVPISLDLVDHRITGSGAVALTLRPEADPAGGGLKIGRFTVQDGRGTPATA
ncbi:Dihydrofolate reductase [Nakamurella panacisegetis]|uniref:Dihydrofolate reductase n=1 Tax=Nakamurella panacisegetis TaxID=1090615 RepID=A0A1H0KU47_9ACTN|nr:dihydrofolate reductase family protein [Nakamurella panacisegetis]SDO59306.1 Dihydrofolate reductase [Nakamurella panacisegetis]